MLPKDDRNKIILLSVIYILCSLSAFYKFGGFSDFAASIPTDFQICQHFSVGNITTCTTEYCISMNQTYFECKGIVINSFKEVNKVCSGYLIQLERCKSRSPTKCATQASNADGCKYSILESFLKIAQISYFEKL